MLLYRSISLQVCLVLTLTGCYCQDYEGSYDIEESDDHSDVQDDSGPVDYSRYYTVDTSAPLVTSQGNPSEIGFTSPIEHAGFFAPSIDFGASFKKEVAQPRNPFAPQQKTLGGFVAAAQHQFPDFVSSPGYFPIDYFEEAQKAQNQANQEEGETFVPDGPSYISHDLPLTLDGEYSSDVKVKKPAKKKKSRKFEYDVEREAATEYDYQPSAPSGKYTDYNTGKSSSTVAQQPEAAGFYEKHTETPSATPYQKYSFQPVTEKTIESKFLGSLISTVAPFNPSYNKLASTAAPASFEGQSSENVPAHLKGKNCRRVRKHIPEDHGRRKRDAMNCYVCEDADNNAKFTQCSYAVEPEPQNDYSGISERYSTPAKEEGFRYKRYSGDEITDPYEYIKSRSQKAYDIEENKDFGEYKIPEFYTGSEGLDKSFSEAQSEAIAKNPANCHKEESEGMTCTICKDPKTGGNFEQCSYTSEPKAQKYAYVTEKKYDSDEPEEGSESKPVVQTKEVGSNIKSDKDEKESGNLNEQPSSKSDKSEVKDFSFDSSEYSPSKLPNLEKYKNLEDFSVDSDYKPLTSASNDNKKYEDFKPAELYKSNYQGHDKFKLSALYNPDSNEDPSTTKEKVVPSEGYQGGFGAPTKLIHDDPYDVPKHFAESTLREQKKKVNGLEPSYYGSADSSEIEGEGADSSSDSEPYKDIEEYHFKLFPEFNHEESQQAAVVANNPSADSTRKDVEEVLAEFSKKDRSDCKKAEKNGMTCYLCVDKKGIQHEECMYVSESKPQASHLAYHEIKQIKSPENKENEPAGTEIKTQQVETTPAPVIMQAQASHEYETRVKYNPRIKKSAKKVKKVKEPAEEEYEEVAQEQEQAGAASDDEPERMSAFEDEPQNKTPAEFEVAPEEGAYSAETKPVYSKTLGVKLPRYMIEKSEFEKEFDEFAGTH